MQKSFPAAFVFPWAVIAVFCFTHSNQLAPVVSRQSMPQIVLVQAPPIYVKSFVDCNMAEAWIGDTFRIFPGKYGEDPLWGNARDLKFTNGTNAAEAFSRQSNEFIEPVMPQNAKPGSPGLHGAVWFETVYQDAKDVTGKTLYAVYHLSLIHI